MTSTTASGPEARTPGSAPASTGSEATALRATGHPACLSQRAAAGTERLLEVGRSTGLLQAADALTQVTRALCSPAGVVGAALETAWVSTHLALYPFGLCGRAEDAAVGDRYSVTHLPPLQRSLVIGDVEAAGTPILLVHGMGDNRSIFTLLRRGLLRRGFGRVRTLNYSPLTADVRTAAALLALEVEQLVAETGYERVHVVGHSLGGLIARYYVTRLGGDQRVHTLVTLGTPHSGTYSAYALPSRLCRQLRPGSGLMRELAEPVPGCRTRFLAYWSDLDQLVLPQAHARLEHPDLAAHNIEVHGLGHMSLPISGRVVHGISTALAHLDPDGSTVTAGVAYLAAPAARATVAGSPGGTRRTS
jgi:pimeloyl-ACP methyl ester carboxylesterase